MQQNSSHRHNHSKSSCSYLALDPHLSCCVVSVLAMGLHCMSVSEKVDVIFTYPLG